jgi:hypothetical protein
MHRLRHLQRQPHRTQFGRRSEKLDPEQLLPALEDIEQAVAGNEATEDRPGRGRPYAGAPTSVAATAVRTAAFS